MSKVNDQQGNDFNGIVTLTPGGALVKAIRSAIHLMSGYASKVKLHNDIEILVSLAVVSGITEDMNLTLIRGRGRDVS